MPRRRSSFGTSFSNSFKGFSDAVLKKEKSDQNDENLENIQENN